MSFENLDYNFTDLVEGQEQKEATINANFEKIAVIFGSLEDLGEYFGELSSAPTGKNLGSTYYNTTTKQLMFLWCKTPSDKWMTIGLNGGYLGDLASDPAAGYAIGSRYYNTTSSKFKTLRSIGPDVWTFES